MRTYMHFSPNARFCPYVRFMGSVCCVYGQTTSPQLALFLSFCHTMAPCLFTSFAVSCSLTPLFQIFFSPPLFQTPRHQTYSLLWTWCSDYNACLWLGIVCSYWACSPGQVVTWIQLQSRGAISSARRPPAPSESSLLYLCRHTSPMKHSGVPGETSQDIEPRGSHYGSIWSSEREREGERESEVLSKEDNKYKE